jgi:uncharacterized damage-inducible protein DinB
MKKNDVRPTEIQNESLVITSRELLDHWQAHRRLTRRVIEAFPDDKLFTYSVGGMRPFAALAQEMIAMAAPGMKGVVTGQWEHYKEGTPPSSKQELLQIWDHTTEQIDSLWAQIPAGRFQEVDVAFGQWEGTIHSSLFYWIDNEIHHRGQGYVYLRSLGIEPPAFWDRS